jgi:hypothetical protein
MLLGLYEVPVVVFSINVYCGELNISCKVSKRPSHKRFLIAEQSHADKVNTQ